MAVSFGTLAILRLFGRLIGAIVGGVGFSAKIQSLGLGDLLWFTADWRIMLALLVLVFIAKFAKDMTRLGDKFLTGKHTPLEIDLRHADAFSGIAYASYDGLFAMANYLFSQSAVKNKRTITNLGLASLAAIAAYMLTVIL